MRTTAESIISAIAALPRNITYGYVNDNNHGRIEIVDVCKPVGPIYFKRWNPSKNTFEHNAKVEKISYGEILRLANAFQPGEPINVDRILGGSYNTRSVLESLIAHTPEFYHCRPGRIQQDGDVISIKQGHKHLVWVPEHPHRNGCLGEEYTEVEAVSEIPPRQAAYKELEFGDKETGEIRVDNGDDELHLRRHTQIQFAAYEIGLHMNYYTWIAQNDYKIKIGGKPICDYDKVVKSLFDCPIISSNRKAVEAARLIDCIWLNTREIPAVMEVEHSTGITSGLSRMLNFETVAPRLANTRYVIIAPDDQQNHVKKESNKELYLPLDTRFFPYSAVEELCELCRRRNIRGISQEFLDCYMEPMVN